MNLSAQVCRGGDAARKLIGPVMITRLAKVRTRTNVAVPSDRADVRANALIADARVNLRVSSRRRGSKVHEFTWADTRDLVDSARESDADFRDRAN